jgi:hypothetical protein
MRVCGMRTGIAFTVDVADRARLEAIVADRSPQKHVWRARIILLTSAGIGTSELGDRARRHARQARSAQRGDALDRGGDGQGCR